MSINAPISEVFTYFARPEHMADQFPENMGLNILPLEVKNGFGVGTIFRISGDFDGKRLEWDCETIEYIPHRKIVAKMRVGQSPLILSPWKKRKPIQVYRWIMICQWVLLEDL